MKKKIKINGYDNLISCSDITLKSISHAIRMHCSLTKLQSIEFFEKLAGLNSHKICNFCNNPIKQYSFKYEILKNEVIEKLTARKERNKFFNLITIKLIGVDYYDNLFYCRQTTCPGKKLNSNSIEYVSKAFNLSKKDALTYIHTRNKSPFYRENHKTYEDYKNYQNIFLRLKDTHDLSKIIQDKNYSSSLKGYKDRFGIIDGEIKWKIVQSKKKITIENLSRLYSIDKAEEIIANWKNKTRHNLENFINRYGDEVGKQKYEQYLKTISDRFRTVRIKEDGFIFNSKMELKFYHTLKRKKFPWTFLVNCRYPNSLMYSDFYFPLIDRHLEIAGAWHMPNYAEKIQLKIELFDPIIVKKYEEYDIIVDNLINFHQGKYFEY